MQQDFSLLGCCPKSGHYHLWSCGQVQWKNVFCPFFCICATGTSEHGWPIVTSAEADVQDASPRDVQVTNCFWHKVIETYYLTHIKFHHLWYCTVEFRDNKGTCNTSPVRRRTFYNVSKHYTHSRRFESVFRKFVVCVLRQWKKPSYLLVTCQSYGIVEIG